MLILVSSPLGLELKPRDKDVTAKFGYRGRGVRNIREGAECRQSGG